MTSWRRSAAGLAGACHPGPVALVTVLATAWAVGIGSSAGTTVLVLLAVLTGQLSVGWSNDWLDVERDAVSNRADKPTVSGSVTVTLLRRAMLVAAVLCIPLSLTTGWVAGSVHLVTVASAWTYNLGLKSTLFSWLPYAVSFGLLPLFVVLADFPGATVPVWLMLATALLGVGAHVANTLPDLADDQRTEVYGLPHRLGRRPSSILAPVILSGATLVVALAPGRVRPLITWLVVSTAVAVAVAGGVVAGMRPRSRAPFTLSMVVATICVLLLVLAGPAVVDLHR